MEHVVLMSIPALRAKDLDRMPRLTALMDGGGRSELQASFPAVTWPVQANMLTGVLPDRHGVVANGFFWRDSREVEMWTAWNDKILSPQVWDRLHQRQPPRSSAVWFPMLSKGCGADYICMPAPIHNPDGSESLWCYTRPQEYYGEMLEQRGHFPLKHFWGPLANIQSTDWIVDTAAMAAERFRPEFFYIYLPHLDYAAQRTGPDSAAALTACEELDAAIGRLAERWTRTIGASGTLWLAASEYVITAVDHVSYPNRMLREAGLLEVRPGDGGEQLDLEGSRAWALVDHQFSHVFVRDQDQATVGRVADLFQAAEGIDQVLAGEQRGRYGMDHERSGELILISDERSWQAYYWWLDDTQAPDYARTVDIHRKPGYDPVELHFDMRTRSTPLDATLVRGSHGAPVRSAEQRGVLLASAPDVLPQTPLRDVDVCDIVLEQLT